MPVGDILQVRLTSRVCSEASRVGDRVTAIVLGRTGGELNDELSGAELSGVITEIRGVGFGIKHARARIRLSLDMLQVPGAEPVTIRTRLIGVDNAREIVDTAGTIHGIDAGAGPANQVSSRMVHLPSLNPYPDLALLTYKLVSPVFADPEIHFPAGTELALLVTEPFDAPSGAPLKTEVRYESDERLEELIRDLPVRTRSGNGDKLADVVNLVLVGESDQLTRSFRSAGWSSSDQQSTAAVLRGIMAALEQRNYEKAPFAKQTVGGRAPDMTWQKGLNDQSKRHHLRVWQSTEGLGDQDVWFASATRDVSAGFDLKRFRMFHHIEPNLDHERGKIVRDLMHTGCVDSVSWVDRPWVMRRMVNSSNDEMTTDGKIAVVFMGPCRADAATAPTVVADRDVHHGPVIKRWMRKEVLSLRYDVLRANIIGTSVEVARLLWRRWRPLESPESLAVNSLLERTGN